jgi:ribosome-associated translation inhibitor RaiA
MTPLTQVYKDITQMEADIKTIDDAIEAVENAHYGVDMRIAIKRGFEIISGLVTDGDLASKDDIDAAINKLTKSIDSRLDKMDARINRIVLGTDDETIRTVVNQILKDEGIIK